MRKGRIKFPYLVRVEFIIPDAWKNEILNHPLLIVGNSKNEEDFIISYLNRTKHGIYYFNLNPLNFKIEDYSNDLMCETFCEISPESIYGERFMLIHTPDDGVPFLSQKLYRSGPSIFLLNKHISKLLNTSRVGEDFVREHARAIAEFLIKRQSFSIIGKGGSEKLLINPRHYGIEPYNPLSSSTIKQLIDVGLEKLLSDKDSVKVIAETKRNEWGVKSGIKTGNNKSIIDLYDKFVKEPELMGWL